MIKIFKMYIFFSSTLNYFVIFIIYYSVSVVCMLLARRLSVLKLLVISLYYLC